MEAVERKKLKQKRGGRKKKGTQVSIPCRSLKCNLVFLEVCLGCFKVCLAVLQGVLGILGAISMLRVYFVGFQCVLDGFMYISCIFNVFWRCVWGHFEVLHGFFIVLSVSISSGLSMSENGISV